MLNQTSHSKRIKIQKYKTKLTKKKTGIRQLRIRIKCKQSKLNKLFK